MKYRMSLLQVNSAGEITDMETTGYDETLEGTEIDCRMDYYHGLLAQGMQVDPDRITTTLVEE